MSIRTIIIIVSLVISVGLIGGAVAKSTKNQHGVLSSSTTTAIQPVSQATLAAADGKNGKDCLVAIDRTVYRIDQANMPLWQNGQHTPSNGLAYCGADLSNVIDQAPHGRSILALLQKVGPLTQ